MLHEGDEVLQSLARMVQLESQSASRAEILSESLAKAIHRAPPGHGKASVRSASISTLV